MAVAHDGEANVSGAVNFGNTITLASKTTAGSDRAGVVMVGWENAEGATVSSVTWNGVSMGAARISQVNDLQTPDAIFNSSIYVIVNPPTGASDVVVTFSDDVRGGAGAAGFTGVDQTTPVRAGSTVGLEASAGGTQSVTVNASAGDMAVDAAMDESGGGGATVDASQTQVFKVENTSGGEKWSMGSYEALSGSSVGMAWDSTDFWCQCALALASAGATAELEQEGFRWGVDDDSESAHTFEAAQDTSIEIDDSQSRLLRVLVDGTLDPASTAFTLRYQKNGSGGYTAVPVGASSKTTPVIEAGDATESGNNTATTSWATVAYPNASTGDLLIFCISWDDSTATTDVAEPAGPNSEVLSEINATPATDAGTETRCKCWYTVATGTWTAGNLTFTPTASEQWTAAVIRIPAGEFDSVTPIGGSGTNGAAAGDETAVLNAAFTAGSTDGGGKLCVWTSADADPQTVAANWTEVANEDRGAVSGGFFTRDAAVTNSESISAGTVATIASDSWASVTFVVRAPTVNNEVYITTSANITGGGEATTARLTAPSGKTTGDFTTGRRWDDENGSDSIDIAEDFYTELEWLVALSSTPSPDDFFDFRVYAGSSALDTYTVTPRWAIPSAGGGLSIPIAMYHYRRMSH